MSGKIKLLSMKKIIIITSVILILAAISIGVYFAWQKSKSILTPPSVPAANVSGDIQFQNSANQKKIKILGSQPAIKYWLAQSATTSDIFYANQSGQILKISQKKEDKDEAISDRQFNDIKNILTSKDGKNIIIENGQKKSQFEIFNLDKKVWQTIPNALSVAFSPDGKKIAYLDNSGTAANLITKSIGDGKQKSVKIISINQKDFSINWRAENKIILVSRPSYYYRGEIWQINLLNKTISFLTSGYGLIINWFDNSDIGLKFETDPRKNNTLSLIDDKGDLKANMGFTTLPEKCANNYPMIYCAIPKSFNAIKEPTLPDDYFKKAVYSSDIIYKIDATNNSYESISVPQSFDLDMIYPSLFNNQILFINRYDGRIYAIELQ